MREDVALRSETCLKTCLRPALEIGGRSLLGGVAGVGSCIGQSLIASQWYALMVLITFSAIVSMSLLVMWC
jgi:hypothetical protein